ncbi:MAG: OmpA family protein [Gemmatimonadaceae bacterium]|nr:OmpA family protein [Acetobacteraceae bacterium]
MKLRSALLAATVLAAPVAAHAEVVSGLYIGAGAGANFMHDENVKSIGFPQLGIPQTNLSRSGRGKIEMDTGFVGVASIGYGLGNGLRLEIEGSYRQNQVGKANNLVGAGGVSASGGDQNKYGGMFNVLYDINIAGSPITPYVGLGVGYSWVQQQNTRYSGRVGPVAGFPTGFNELLRTNAAEGSFAYQAIVGGAFALGVPGLSLTAEYRFLGLAEERRYNYQYFAPGVSSRARVTFDENYNHSVLVGLRYAFNAAPPPPPVVVPVAAPARVDARTYLVFFDWDRADLTDRARQIIAEAAQATTRVQVTRIEVSGHTDKSGTPAYNQGLSVRRAQNVASELVRLGVPRQAITTQGFGEARPLVQTADGVREPQNRRVEIVLR